MLRDDFACGYQWYLDSLPGAIEAVPRVVVTAIAEGLEFTALLDTGANQCVLDWSIAEQLATHSDEAIDQIRALGGNVYLGRLFPVTITFPADEGTDVSLEISAWSAETFAGPNLIGYGGVLERLRIALDPETNRFFFGS